MELQEQMQKFEAAIKEGPQGKELADLQEYVATLDKSEEELKNEISGLIEEQKSDPLLHQDRTQCEQLLAQVDELAKTATKVKRTLAFDIRKLK